MMKRILYIALAAAVLLGTSSCQMLAVKRATNAVNGYMAAYDAMDYETAASFCTEPMAALLLESAEGMDEIPQVIMEKMKEASNETSFRIASMCVNNERTEAVAEVLVKAPGLEKEVPKTLRLVFEGRTALVYAVE